MPLMKGIFAFLERKMNHSKSEVIEKTAIQFNVLSFKGKELDKDSFQKNLF